MQTRKPTMSPAASISQATSRGTAVRDEIEPDMLAAPQQPGRGATA